MHGFPELRTKDSIFAELSEKINFEKMSTQVSQLLDVATNRLEEIDVTSLQNDFAKSNFALQAFLKTFSDSYSSLGRAKSSLIQAKSSMQDISRLSKTLNLMLQPDSELRFQFSDTLAM